MDAVARRCGLALWPMQAIISTWREQLTSAGAGKRAHSARVKYEVSSSRPASWASGDDPGRERSRPLPPAVERRRPGRRGPGVSRGGFEPEQRADLWRCVLSPRPRALRGLRGASSRSVLARRGLAMRGARGAAGAGGLALRLRRVAARIDRAQNQKDRAGEVLREASRALLGRAGN